MTPAAQLRQRQRPATGRSAVQNSYYSMRPAEYWPNTDMSESRRGILPASPITKAAIKSRYRPVHHVQQTSKNPPHGPLPRRNVPRSRLLLRKQHWSRVLYLHSY